MFLRNNMTVVTHKLLRYLVHDQEIKIKKNFPLFRIKYLNNIISYATTVRFLYIFYIDIRTYTIYFKLLNSKVKVRYLTS